LYIKAGAYIAKVNWELKCLQFNRYLKK